MGSSHMLTKSIRFAGLLMNNLGIFHGCQIAFDSQEIPDHGNAQEALPPDDAQVIVLTSKEQERKSACHEKRWTQAHL